MAVEHDLVLLDLRFCLLMLSLAGFSSLVCFFDGFIQTRSTLFSPLKFGDRSLERPDIPSHLFDAGDFGVYRLLKFKKGGSRFLPSRRSIRFVGAGPLIDNHAGHHAIDGFASSLVLDLTHDIYAASCFQVGKETTVFIPPETLLKRASVAALAESCGDQPRVSTVSEGMPPRPRLRNSRRVWDSQSGR